MKSLKLIIKSFLSVSLFTGATYPIFKMGAGGFKVNNWQFRMKILLWMRFVKVNWILPYVSSADQNQEAANLSSSVKLPLVNGLGEKRDLGKI